MDKLLRLALNFQSFFYNFLNSWDVQAVPPGWLLSLIQKQRQYPQYCKQTSLTPSFVGPAEMSTYWTRLTQLPPQSLRPVAQEHPAVLLVVVLKFNSVMVSWQRSGFHGCCTVGAHSHLLKMCALYEV